MVSGNPGHEGASMAPTARDMNARHEHPSAGAPAVPLVLC